MANQDPTYTNPYTGIVYNSKTGSILSDPNNKAASVGQVYTPNVSPSMGAEKFGSSPLTTPTLTPNYGASGGVDALTAQGKNVQSQYISELDAKAKAAKDTVNTDVGGITGLYEKLFGQSNRNEEIYKEAGVDEALKAVNTYTSQIEQEQLSNRRQLEEIDKNVNGMTAQALQATKDDVTRKSLSKQADIAVLQGAAARNYDAVSAAADRKVKAETDALNNELKAREFFYEAHKDEYDKADQRAYEAKNDEIKQQIEDKKLGQAYIVDAVSQGAPTDVIRRAQELYNSGADPVAIAQVLGKYSSAAQDAAYKNAQIRNINSEIANRGLDTGSAGGLDAAGVLAYANQYASTGTIPTGLPKGAFGLIAQVAKETPKPVGTLVDINTGIKPSALSAGQIDGIIALKDVESKLAELKTMPRYGGPNTVVAYKGLRNEIIDLLARARTGAAISANEERLYKDKIPSLLSFTPGAKIDSLSNSIGGKLNTTLKTNGVSIYGYSKVNIGGNDYTVGDIISNGTQQARVNPDGTLTLIQ